MKTLSFSPAPGSAMGKTRPQSKSPCRIAHGTGAQPATCMARRPHWVISRKAQNEHITSALHPKADIRLTLQHVCLVPFTGSRLASLDHVVGPFRGRYFARL